MFVMPPSCELFGKVIPQVGTQVKFVVVPDSKTGRPRAENVEPADGSGQVAFGSAAAMRQDLNEEEGRCSGTIMADNGKFGFIKQDSGEEDMFALPPLLPVGSRVSYTTVVDAKTGRPRAENIRDLNTGRSPPAFGVQPGCGKGGGKFGGGFQAMGGMGHGGMGMAGPGQLCGTMSKSNEKFGFISQDNGDADMFCLPPFFPQGARLSYNVVQDPKTGRPRAEDVQCLDGGGGGGFGGGAGGTAPWLRAAPYGGGGCKGVPAWQQQQQQPAFGGGKGGGFKGGKAAFGGAAPAFGAAAAGSGEVFLGTVKTVTEKFAFITQDADETTDMFCIPPSCEAFGRTLPPVGQRVSYTVVVDGRSGRPRAENVSPA
jgi:cold shock CspA family protein